MRKLFVILCVVCTSFLHAQQITFSDILSAEKTPKIVGAREDRQATSNFSSEKSYSPLITLDYVFFESYLNVIGSIGMIEYGYPVTNATPMGGGIEYEFGWRFSPMVFLGAGIGARGYYTKNSDYARTVGVNLPLYAALKLYMIYDYDFSLSADIGLGGCFTIRYTPPIPSGLYLRCGLGMDMRRFTIGAGYEMVGRLFDPIKLGHFGYVKLGVIISK